MNDSVEDRLDESIDEFEEILREELRLIRGYKSKLRLPDN
jgi:hypothetical protein